MGKGDRWRTHENKVLKYSDGSWRLREVVECPEFHELSAAEGLLIRLSEFDNLTWDWNEVKPRIEEFIN